MISPRGSEELARARCRQRYLLLCIAVALISIAAGCVNVQSRLAKNSIPEQTSGYVGVLSSRDTIWRFGFRLTDQRTGKEYLVGLARNGFGLIKLPPGRYRVTAWITYTVTNIENSEQAIPVTHAMGRSFDLEGGQVMILGRWFADRYSSGDNTIYKLSSGPLTDEDAVAVLRENYKHFSNARVTCLVCDSAPAPVLGDRFSGVLADGSLHNVMVHAASGVPELDEEALRAVRAAWQVEAPPDGLVNDGRIRLRFRFSFQGSSPASPSKSP